MQKKNNNNDINILTEHQNRKKKRKQKKKNKEKKINNFIDNNKKRKRNKMVETDNIPESVKKISINETKKNEINEIKYTDDELNLLPYDLAIKNDKRSYTEYYISLLKTKHNFIFSFIYNGDYNSKIIKIDLFFIHFSLHYTVNALFFSDNTMHKIYQDNGSFNLSYQIPIIIYSLLISSFLYIILKLLALSNDAIIKFKKNKSKKNINERHMELNIQLRNKFLIYFIISSLLLLFFWYYLSTFGSIYHNTQILLLKDTLISFASSMIYPFGIYLLPGIFRIRALSDTKKNKKYLYNFSKVVQFL